MEFPIRVEQRNGEYVASVLGELGLQASHATWEGAIEAIRSMLAQKIVGRELASVEVRPSGVLATFGSFRDDPTLREICDEIYRERDRERDQLPEDYK